MRKVAPSPQFYLNRCDLFKRARALFENEIDRADSKSLHQIKSLLYAAIEKSRLKREALLSFETSLRELLIAVTTSPDASSLEDGEGLKMLDQIEKLTI